MRFIPAFFVMAAGGLLFAIACAADPTHAGPDPAPALPATYDPMRSFAPLVEVVKPAVVHVFVDKKVKVPRIAIEGFPFFRFGPEGLVPPMEEDQDRIVSGEGSGFLISANGEILTNNHVVERADNVKVKLADGQEYPARLVGTDPRTDLALIRIEAKEPLPALALGSSDDLQVGDWVVAIGNPLGLAHTVTAGIVSAKGRVIGATTYDDFIQTDAAINLGNSGGPLLDTQGRVVGINTLIIGQGTGLGFAVPIDMAREILDELRSSGRVARGWLGVQMQSVDADLAEALGVSGGKGALVNRVYPDTPAAKAGLENGDVVTALDNQEVEDSTALVREVGRHRPGDTVTLRIVRGGKTRDLRVKLAERPDEDQLAQGVYLAPESEEDPSAEPRGTGHADRFGITLSLPSDTSGRRRGVSQRPVVAEVAVDGPAQGRLEPGDVILEIDHEPVATVAEAHAALKKAGDVALLLVERQDLTRYVAVRARDAK
ncbi:MAG: Do family serine endopeptidase [Deltaproteobacteria bacterium]|nr:Do family serine endopeptidase [Deltaproteobacteria bacterium]